jgi:integrase
MLGMVRSLTWRRIHVRHRNRIQPAYPRLPRRRPISPQYSGPPYIWFTIKNCKTDSIDRRDFASTANCSGSTICAVMIPRELFLADPQPVSVPLFRFNDPINAGARTPASIRPHARDSSHRTLTKIFSQLLLLSGHNDENVSSHSFRHGGATALFRSGASEYMVMQAGRWQSACWRYNVDNDQTFFHYFASKSATSTSTTDVHWDSETVPTFA